MNMKILENIARSITKSYGDKGSCVLGYKLLLDGEQIISQPAQGSSTCDFVYNVITNLLVDQYGFDKSRITRDYGRMD